MICDLRRYNIKSERIIESKTEELNNLQDLVNVYTEFAHDMRKLTEKSGVVSKYLTDFIISLERKVHLLCQENWNWN